MNTSKRPNLTWLVYVGFAFIGLGFVLLVGRSTANSAATFFGLGIACLALSWRPTKTTSDDDK